MKYLDDSIKKLDEKELQNIKGGAYSSSAHSPALYHCSFSNTCDDCDYFTQWMWTNPNDSQTQVWDCSQGYTPLDQNGKSPSHYDFWNYK